MKDYKPRNASEALRLAKSWEKAQTMRKDLAYQFIPFVSNFSNFYVFKNGKPEYITMVTVWHCTCPDFAKHGKFCKHLLCANEILRDEQLVPEYEQLEAAAEILSTGCDYRL